MSEYVEFVVWLAIYPVISALGNLLGAKVRKECGVETYTLSDIQSASLIQAIIWVVVAYLLYP